MWAQIQNFLYRHRRKFVLSGIVIGGLAFATRYAERRLVEWHDRETRSLIEKQKRRQHYESTQRTANATVLSLSGTVRDILLKEFDADTLLHAVRDQPTRKHIIWEELKVVSFSRVIGIVYTSAILTTAIHVHLMLLGGYTFGELIDNNHAGVTITPYIQQRYLVAVQYMMEVGFPKLLKQIERAVKHIVEGLPLNKLLTLGKLESVFQDIILCLSGESVTNEASANNAPFQVDSWSHYVVEACSSGQGPENYILHNMITETADVLDSDDCSIIIQHLIQQGINHILDRVADFYPSVPASVSANNNTEQWIDKTNETKASEDELLKENADEHAVIPSKNIAPLQNACSGLLLMETELPVAKLIPILSALLNASLSPAPGHLLQKVLINDKLESFGCNIYESFSVSLKK